MILNDLERASCTMNFIAVFEVCGIWRGVFICSDCGIDHKCAMQLPFKHILGVMEETTVEVEVGMGMGIAEPHDIHLIVEEMAGTGSDLLATPHTVVTDMNGPGHHNTHHTGDESPCVD